MWSTQTLEEACTKLSLWRREELIAELSSVPWNGYSRVGGTMSRCAFSIVHELLDNTMRESGYHWLRLQEQNDMNGLSLDGRTFCSPYTSVSIVRLLFYGG